MFTPKIAASLHQSLTQTASIDNGEREGSPSPRRLARTAPPPGPTLPPPALPQADYKPTTEIPVATAAPVVAVAPYAGRPAPPGAPPGGHYAMKPVSSAPPNPRCPSPSTLPRPTAHFSSELCSRAPLRAAPSAPHVSPLVLRRRHHSHHRVHLCLRGLLPLRLQGGAQRASAPCAPRVPSSRASHAATALLCVCLCVCAAAPRPSSAAAQQRACVCRHTRCPHCPPETRPPTRRSTLRRTGRHTRRRAP